MEMKVATAPSVPGQQNRVSRRKRRWTKAELSTLTFRWGYDSLEDIATALQRSQLSIEKKARALGLGARFPTMTLAEFSKHSGFSDTKICHALKILGIEPPRRSPITAHAACTAPRPLALDEALQSRLLEFMLAQEVAFSNLPGNARTEAGVWGVGQKPAACLICSRNELPHYARGRCRSCYNKELKRKKRTVVWGRCSPDGCPLGGIDVHQRRS